mmetsp:Transcript_1052/g.1762  ORF Transcript_1052/g.1762 Transcript_1052/m.1762 type:complete len:205 (+) Transcript_1052:404-1018(+)
MEYPPRGDSHPGAHRGGRLCSRVQGAVAGDGHCGQKAENREGVPQLNAECQCGQGRPGERDLNPLAPAASESRAVPWGMHRRGGGGRGWRTDPSQGIHGGRQPGELLRDEEQQGGQNLEAMHREGVGLEPRPRSGSMLPAQLLAQDHSQRPEARQCAPGKRGAPQDWGLRAKLRPQRWRAWSGGVQDDGQDRHPAVHGARGVGY